MKTIRKNKRFGFTLVELLTVIAIMGILIAVLVPAVQQGIVLANKQASSNNLRNIAQGYKMFAEGSGRLRNITKGSDPVKGQANSPATYAEVLARHAGITSGEIWYISSDPYINGQIPANVLTQVTNGTNQLNDVKPVSWAVVVNASRNLDTNYPLVWTRGLGMDGKWTMNAPWKDSGGHIAFGDAHVRWYSSMVLTGEQFVNLKDGTETENYKMAIGDNAEMYEDSI